MSCNSTLPISLREKNSLRSPREMVRVREEKSSCINYNLVPRSLIRELKILRRVRDFVSIVFARKPASFGQEFVVAVVILLRVLAREGKLSNVRNFSILQSGEVFSSFKNDNSANFSGEKKYNEEFRGVYFLTIREKTLNQISY